MKTGEQTLPHPVAYENGRGDALPRMKVDVAEKNGAYVVTARSCPGSGRKKKAAAQRKQITIQ